MWPMGLLCLFIHKFFFLWRGGVLKFRVSKHCSQSVNFHSLQPCWLFLSFVLNRKWHNVVVSMPISNVLIHIMEKLVLIFPIFYISDTLFCMYAGPFVFCIPVYFLSMFVLKRDYKRAQETPYLEMEEECPEKNSATTWALWFLTCDDYCRFLNKEYMYFFEILIVDFL